MRLLLLGSVLLALVGEALAGAPQRLFVTALWRHGDRSAIKRFPLDPNNNENTWPQGWGQLSMLGMQEHLQLGQLLRKRYQGFLSPVFKQDEVYIRSTDVNRTLVSALSNMAGMFQGTPGNLNVLNGIPSDPAWPKHWLPVPIHTLPRDQDVCNMGCQAADDYYKYHVQKQSNYTYYVNKYANFYQYLHNVTGYPKDNKTTFDDMYWIYDTILCERYHSNVHRLPNWALNQTVWNMTRDLATANNKFYITGVRRMLKGGPILQEIVQRMQRKLSCLTNSSLPFCKEVKTLKYYVYSAHDSTVSKVMGAMGTMSYMPRATPDYAGCILWELWTEADGTHSIRTFYKNGIYNPNFVNMTIPGCPSYICPLNTFLKALKPIFPPGNIHKLCASTQYKQKKSFMERERLVLREGDEEEETEELKTSAFSEQSNFQDFLTQPTPMPVAQCPENGPIKGTVIGLSVANGILFIILAVMVYKLKEKGISIPCLPSC